MQKKKLLFYGILIFFVIMFIVLSYIVIYNVKKMSTYKCTQSVYDFAKENSEVVFSVDKIVYFSGANANSSINANSSFTISDLYQYTDIAIFINNHADGNFTAKNTLKNVCLSNIKFQLSPSIGTPNLYFQNINNFATNSYDENKLITDTIDFTCSSDDIIDYSTPTLYNNCANPITLCYINSNIKASQTLTDTVSNISYDGSLLKYCNITLNSISCKISFLITIVNNLNELYTCPMVLTIPLSTENSTLYDGNLTLNTNTNYIFIKNFRNIY